MDAARGTDLVFRYRGGPEAPALAGCSFHVRFGEVYGVLGPNGAGKTTLLKLLGTLLLPSAGRLEILGLPVPGNERAIRSELGLAVGEYERTFHFRLSAADNLRYFAAFYPRLSREHIGARIREVLDQVGLGDAARRPYHVLSQGMKHRLALARALLARPRLLLLDEPTAGVDPATSRAFLGLVRRLADEGLCVVFTTHRLMEAGDLCDRVLLLRGGRPVAEASPDELRRLSVGNEVLDLRLSPRPDATLLRKIARLANVAAVFPSGANGVRVHYRADSEAPFAVFALIKKGGHALRDVRRDAPSLEDAFVRLTGGTPA